MDFSYNILDIEYKNQDLCFSKHAISAEFNFKLKNGSLVEFPMKTTSYLYVTQNL